MKKSIENELIRDLEDYLASKDIYPDALYCKHLDMADGLAIQAVLKWAGKQEHSRYSQLIHVWAEMKGFRIVCPDYFVDADTTEGATVFTATHHVGLMKVGMKKGK